MRRLLPSPWLSLGLFCGWLLLNRSVSIGQVLMGLLVAVALPLLMAPLRPTPGPLRHWGTLVRLILRVGMDVVLSGLQVARGVLRSRIVGTRTYYALRSSQIAALVASIRINYLN